MTEALLTRFGAFTHVLSDTHFFHDRLAREYEPSRMTLGADHNTVMIDRWQDAVSEGGSVLHLGDLALGKREDFERVAGKLPGRGTIVLGNHDRRGKGWYRSLGFDPVKPFTVTYRGWNVMFSHYPDDQHEHVCFPRHLNVHGHVHSQTREDRRLINVSVEVIGFRPVPLCALLDERISELDS